MKQFNSFLRRHLEAYLALKQSLGFTSFAKPGTARDFDYYVVFRGLARIEQIDEAFVAHWIHAVPRNPGTKNSKLKFARGFFDYLIRLGLARENPALRIAYLRNPTYKPHIYALKEIHDILKETDRFKRLYPKRLLGWTLETMIFLIYACGLRISEAINLRIVDVNFEENTLSLWRTKFHKERLIPFSSAVGRKLETYLVRRRQLHPTADTEAPFFCRYAGRKYTGKTIDEHFRTLRDPRGQKGPRIHDLRHTFAVHRLYKWYQDGRDPLNKLPLLSTYMGHVGIESTQVYLHITQTLLREGDRRFDAAFGDVVEQSLKHALKKP